MKKSMLTAAASLMLLSAAAHGQATSPGEGALNASDGKKSASALLGAAVYDADGSEIAKISDLVIAGSEIVAVELAIGGFLGVGDRHVEVPYRDLRIADDSRISVARSESELLAPAESADGRAPGDGEQIPSAETPEEIEPLRVDEDLAEIDPRLAEGIAANEEAFGEELDHESFDNDGDSEQRDQGSASE